MSESYDEPATTKGNNKSYVGNPRAPRGEEYDESTGPVTSDSLANESIKQGGGFGDNANPDVYDVTGASSTFTNTDTSSARRLNAARDREERDGDRFSSTDYPFGSTSSTSTTTSYDNDNNSEGSESGIGGRSHTQTASGGSSYNSNTDTAPSYASTTAGHHRSHGELRPKGDNLDEIEDDDDTRTIRPNKKTYTGDVGGPNDPGRLAEAKYQLSSARSGADAGYPRDKGEVSSGTKYDVLDGSERA